MEYPFPGPEPSVLLKMGVIVVLLGCLGLPIAHVLWHRCQTTARDRILGLAAALVAVIAGPAYPHESYGIPDQASPVVTMLAFMAIVANLGWAITTGADSNKRWHSLPSIAVSYGAACAIAGLNVTYWGVSTPRESARRVQCRNNLKQIGLGFNTHYDEDQRFSDLVVTTGQQSRSWRVDLLPYVGEQDLPDPYVDTAAWNHEVNLPAAKHRVEAYVCPSTPEPRDSRQRWFTAYAGVRGANSMFQEERGLMIGDIADGSTNTFMIVEACGRQIVWTEPRDIDVSRQQFGVNLPGEQPRRSHGLLSSYHRDGAHGLMADGSVRFISEDASPELLRALSTASGADSIPEDWLRLYW